ncbi:hypothetical protein DERF_009652 [Dermatophagoides farinae]|uniref:Uncharacterized protein n=1 Tax=Dermatophagoides farinae TaxID=6954 RepID=A0A922HX35_DERFA|nr:hypothetical protein DERF_009652 [Dermatophagoides farinae]
MKNIYRQESLQENGEDKEKDKILMDDVDKKKKRKTKDFGIAKLTRQKSERKRIQNIQQQQ